MANVLEAIMKGIQGGAGAYQENRRYKQERADRDEQTAFERNFRENQFKEQLRSEKANRDYQASQLALQAKSGERAAASDEANRTQRQTEFEGQQHDRGIASILDQAKLEGYVPANPEAELAAQKFGGTVRPIHEVMEGARTQANITRRNVDIPRQGTAIYGYNPNDSNQSSMYNAQSDELQGYINGMAVRGEQAANAILHQYKADDPIFPLDEQTRAQVNAHAQAAAQEARDRYADVVWHAKQIDLNGKHKGGQNTTPPPAGPQIDPRYQRLMGRDLAPSDGSAAPSPSSVHGIDLSKVFKKKVQ